MNLRPLFLRGKPRLVWPLLVAANIIFPFGAEAELSGIYFSGFERSEGFDPLRTLVGQGGWTGTDVHGNGLLTNYFTSQSPQPSFGQQQAFVGGYYYSYPLTNSDGTLNAWRPLNFDPLEAGLPIVTFSVTMAVYDSVTTTNRDCFRWSVYNTAHGGERLFTLDFDNATTEINYELNDDLFVPTGFLFERNGEYDLVVTMNFADNLWSAVLNDFTIVDSQPMTTTNLVLNLGDIDAVWINRQIGVYGDNFMVFDNYSVTAEPYPFWLDAVERLKNGAFLLRLSGEPGRQYAIDASTDFVDWFALKTNSAGRDGTFDFLDATATNYTRSFYRARLVL